MKKLFLLLLVPFLAISCLGKDEVQEEEEISRPSSELIRVSSIYPEILGIRQEPYRDATRVKDAQGNNFHLLFRDEVFWTGNSTVTGRYSWIEVQSLDGSMKGWCWEMYFAPTDSLAILKDRIIIYSQPDLLSVTDTFIEKYQIAGVLNSDGDFIELKWVDSGNNAQSGYVKSSTRSLISMGQAGLRDIQVMDLLNKANAPNTSYEMAKELINNALQETSSSFYQEARQASRDLEAQKQADDASSESFSIGQMLMLNRNGVNVRELPSLNSDVLEMANVDEVVTVIDKTSVAETISGVGTNFWYQVESDKGYNHGWIFGTFLSDEP